MKLPDAPTDHAPQLAEKRSTTDHLCSAKEAAEILRAPLPTIYYLTKNNKLPAIRIGGRWRFRRSDLKAMVSAPSMYSKKQSPAPTHQAFNQDLAGHIAKAIANVQASQTETGAQPMSICVIIVSPTSNGGFELLPQERTPAFTAPTLPAAA